MLKRYTLLHIFTIVKSILRKSRYTCNHGSPYGHKYLKEEQSTKKTDVGFTVTVVLILCLTIFVGCKPHGSKNAMHSLLITSANPLNCQRHRNYTWPTSKMRSNQSWIFYTKKRHICYPVSASAIDIRVVNFF